MSTNGVTVAGNPGPIRIGEQRIVNKASPLEHHVFWRGERVATLAALNTLQNKSTYISYRQDGALGDVEVIYRNDEAVIDTVEIEFNSVQRDWWTIPAYAALTNAERVKIQGALAELTKFLQEEHTPAEREAKLASLGTALGGTLTNAFYDIFYNGDTYIALLPVITWTRMVSQYYNIPIVIEDVGCVFSTASVIGALQLAGVDPGATIQFQIGEVTNTIAANSLQTLGWLKTGRRIVTSDGGAQYVHQWIFDAYRTSGYLFV